MFVAVVLPDVVRESLARHVRASTGDVTGVRWTRPDQWHVTLAFLAAVPAAVLPDLTERLRRAAARQGAFETCVVGAGAFSRPRQARVVWAGVRDDDGALRQLAEAALAAASRAGLDVESKRFRAHLTLGRVAGRPLDLTDVVGALADYAGPVWRVTEIELIASHLGKGEGGRPRYETVATFLLASARRSRVR